MPRTDPTEILRGLVEMREHRITKLEAQVAELQRENERLKQLATKAATECAEATHRRPDKWYGSTSQHILERGLLDAESK